MPSPISIGTREIPLRLAKTITARVNESWESGEMLSRVSLVTQDLLKFWFKEPHTETRRFNFHQGQKQAILNTVYLHEVLKVKDVMDMYMTLSSDLLQEMDLLDLEADKYKHPK